MTRAPHGGCLLLWILRFGSKHSFLAQRETIDPILFLVHGDDIAWMEHHAGIDCEGQVLGAVYVFIVQRVQRGLLFGLVFCIISRNVGCLLETRRVRVRNCFFLEGERWWLWVNDQ